MPTTETEAFERAARALRGAPKELRKEVNRALRTIGKSMGSRVVEQGSDRLPKHGGLSARVARSKVSQTNRTTGSNPSVLIKLASRQGYDLKAMDRGKIRHPVFGDRHAWRLQEITPNAFTDAFETEAPKTRARMVSALQDAAQQIARDAS